MLDQFLLMCEIQTLVFVFFKKKEGVKKEGREEREKI